MATKDWILYFTALGVLGGLLVYMEWSETKRTRLRLEGAKELAKLSKDFATPVVPAA